MRMMLKTCSCGRAVFLPARAFCLPQGRPRRKLVACRSQSPYVLAFVQIDVCQRWLFRWKFFFYAKDLVADFWARNTRSIEMST